MLHISHKHLHISKPKTNNTTKKTCGCSCSLLVLYREKQAAGRLVVVYMGKPGLYWSQPSTRTREHIGHSLSRGLLLYLQNRLLLCVFSLPCSHVPSPPPPSLLSQPHSHTHRALSTANSYTISHINVYTRKPAQPEALKRSPRPWGLTCKGEHTHTPTHNTKDRIINCSFLLVLTTHLHIHCTILQYAGRSHGLHQGIRSASDW